MLGAFILDQQPARSIDVRQDKRIQANASRTLQRWHTLYRVNLYQASSRSTQYALNPNHMLAHWALRPYLPIEV
jgi:hypothetical protein